MSKREHNFMALPGHLSSKGPLVMSRNTDDVTRQADLLAKRARTGIFHLTRKSPFKPAPTPPIVLGWIAPDPSKKKPAVKKPASKKPPPPVSKKTK